MHSRSAKIFVWLWMAALLTATVGVSMQKMYCYCAGKTTLSFFDEGAYSIDNQSDKEDCCAKKEALPVSDCCAESESVCTEQQHSGCMEKSTRIFHLKVEFVVDKPFEKTLDCPLWLGEMPIFKRFFRPVVCENIFHNKPPPPPPLSGRDICLRHQLFRC